MKKKKIEDRFDGLNLAFIIILSIITLRLGYITTIKGEEYATQAENKVFKRIPIEAQRGEIRDRYGRLLAGNRPSFTVQIYKDQIDRNTINQTAKKLIDILERNGEKYIDEFPIIIENGEYIFTYDIAIREWKERNEIPLNYNAEQSFYYLVERYTKEGKISPSPDADKFELQRILNEQAYYPPIRVSTWEFTEQAKKREWLYRYRITDEDITAKETFERLRERFEIDSSLSDYEARKILVVRDLLLSTGYLQYQPIKIALDVSKDTVAKIEEMAISLRGVGIEVEPIRYYPNGNVASHILGQIGKISQQEEIERYINQRGYSITDMIGKTGIERTFEDVLQGKKGYKKVQVDAHGRLVRRIETQNPVPGDTVYLTIDLDVQKAAEESLKKVLETIRAGGVYQSPFGNVTLRGNKVYKNANSGAVVALDVKTGEVLALASYPDYDPNLFATGISREDMNKLLPENPNDPLAPKPLYNIATLTAVQPGSTFKMITGLAAVENGLSPNYTIYDKGYIMLGNRSFGCWIWNDRKGSHGHTDLFKAIQESCNYYFYSVSTGYDYSKNKPLPVKMNVEEVLRYARMFGLDSRTGIQIEEIAGKVPSPDEKLRVTKRALRARLIRDMKLSFEDITQSKNTKEYEKRIDEIVSWTEENPSRGEIIRRLADLKVKETEINKIADLVKYSYFNQADWKTGDTFNLSIGQGQHAYTPLQMANFIATMVNGGYLNKVTVVDRVVSQDKSEVQRIERISEKISLKDPNNLNYLKQGMLDVTQIGTAKGVFANFPIKTGGKTGTAQRSGRIPAKDEKQYLLSHLSSFRVREKDVLELAEKLQKESTEKRSEDYYIRKAIKTLNPSLSDDDINRFKDTYDNFAWYVAYAPHDEPEIAVAVLLFQGGSGGYAAPVARDVMAAYFGLNKDEENENKKEILNLTEQLQR
ncbi:penicillin-binding protein 2 [Alkalithermobacter thermoalcaliphilus JW-YL-7 = DSM 7308]|uniref:Penicillin-binding protein 2 n=1 Tax=Alkalithermobacter thermoalcaliphilus JW-YL-7 = DSM 7308 TaxID=1121328 RepID=A0A150FRC9_CLOPD|nr:Penicillin-binding protein dimerization domain-containing protein [[Clostridium] paradoxum JW-YL-7 = DSM 7308]SHK44581.1 penicillin-binding protein 2 [[Clostridium] paradoxum JW-YL-7 = DSM 7308]